jgi:molybdopterin molybdotransferase
MPAYGSEGVPLMQATGRILRQPVTAERDQPPFDRATMDGVAVSSAALQTGQRRFRLTGVQAAGQAQQALVSIGDCFEIMTGAVMPAGSDTVVPVERVQQQDGYAELEQGYMPKPGQFVHRRASDHIQGDRLLDPGVRIDGPTMAILTAAGATHVSVARQPTIAVISTGDELVDVGEPLADFQIRSSNDRAIESCLRLRGFDQINRSHLPDDAGRLRRQIRQLHADNDMLILSGGVSMGKFDYVPAILNELGVRVIFHKVLQRPGMPMWFGVSEAGKPVFALPGNPVSTIVCCVRYVLPALLAAMGATAPAQERVQLGEAVDFTADLTWFLPVQLRWNAAGIALAMPRPTNTSGDFIGLRNTDGFVELPRGQSHFPAGFAANLYRW